jgi:hypothetical protein
MSDARLLVFLPRQVAPPAVEQAPLTGAALEALMDRALGRAQTIAHDLSADPDASRIEVVFAACWILADLAVHAAEATGGSDADMVASFSAQIREFAGQLRAARLDPPTATG